MINDDGWLVFWIFAAVALAFTAGLLWRLTARSTAAARSLRDPLPAGAGAVPVKAAVLRLDPDQGR
jgi:hypothetical protein